VIARRRRLLEVRTRQHERANADVAVAERVHEATMQDHRDALAHLERLLARAWEVGGVERGAAAVDAERHRCGETQTSLLQAAETRRAAAYARLRAEQALDRAHVEARAAALRREQSEHDDRAARRRR